jgi:hypothetical protein
MLLARLLTSFNPQRSLTDTDGIYCTMHRPSTPSIVFLYTSTLVAHARKSETNSCAKLSDQASMIMY